MLLEYYWGDIGLVLVYLDPHISEFTVQIRFQNRSTSAPTAHWGHDQAAGALWGLSSQQWSFHLLQLVSGDLSTDLCNGRVKSWHFNAVFHANGETKNVF